jgi:hypothetical protein
MRGPPAQIDQLGGRSNAADFGKFSQTIDMSITGVDLGDPTSDAASVKLDSDHRSNVKVRGPTIVDPAGRNEIVELAPNRRYVGKNPNNHRRRRCCHVSILPYRRYSAGFPRRV